MEMGCIQTYLQRDFDPILFYKHIPGLMALLFIFQWVWSMTPVRITAHILHPEYNMILFVSVSRSLANSTKGWVSLIRNAGSIVFWIFKILEYLLIHNMWKTGWCGNKRLFNGLPQIMIPAFSGTVFRKVTLSWLDRLSCCLHSFPAISAVKGWRLQDKQSNQGATRQGVRPSLAGEYGPAECWYQFLRKTAETASSDPLVSIPSCVPHLPRWIMDNQISWGRDPSLLNTKSLNVLYTTHTAWR